MTIAYAAPTAAQKASSGMEFSALDALTSASWPVQLTLLVLVLMSVVCWAIILTKKKSIDNIRTANSAFLDLFWKSGSLDDIFAKIDAHSTSNIARVFRAAYLELRKMADSSLAHAGKDQAAPMLSGIDIHQHLEDPARGRRPLAHRLFDSRSFQSESDDRFVSGDRDGSPGRSFCDQ